MDSTNQPSQILRRDFWVGMTGGLTAGAASWFLAPDRWHEQRLPFGAQVSYSQQGEDLQIVGLCELLKIENPTYVDIGAYEPILGSNSYLLYRRGSRGVLIEPNPTLVPRLRSVRPGDTVLPVGVGFDPEPSTAEYFMLSVPQNNTFDRAHAEQLQASGQVKILEILQMPLIPINQILAEHFPRGGPDVFSIDIEGLDRAVLRSMDFDRFRPVIICVEHSPNQAERDELHQDLVERGYTIRGMSFPNTIAVDNRRWS